MRIAKVELVPCEQTRRDVSAAGYSLPGFSPMRRTVVVSYGRAYG